MIANRFGWRPVLAGIALAVCFGACGCRPAQIAAPVEAASAPLVLETVTVQAQNWPQTVRVQGNLMADEHSVVGAKIAGRVKELKVDIGSVVHQGDVLVTLDAEELDLRVAQTLAQLEQARAKLGLKPGQPEDKLDRERVPMVIQEAATRDEARSNLNRAKTLFAQRAISEEELQQRQAVFEVAEARWISALNQVDEQVATIGVRRAEVDLARQLQTDAVVRAPFEGIVEERLAAPGTYLQLGQAVVRLVRTHPLRFHGGVPEREAMLVKVEQAVELRIERQPTPVLARVSRLSPAMEMSNRSLTIEADVPNPNFALRVGLFAEGSIIVDPDAKTLALPRAAVTEFAGVEKVWRIRKGEAAEQIVQTGRRRGDLIEILDGVTAGDVVARDAKQARAGPVTVRPVAR